MSKDFKNDPVDYSSLIFEEMTWDWDKDFLVLKELRERNRGNGNLVREVDRRLPMFVPEDKKEGFITQVFFEILVNHKEALRIISKSLKEVVSEEDIRDNTPKEFTHKFGKDRVSLIQTARRIILKVETPYSEFLSFLMDYFRSEPHGFEISEVKGEKVYVYHWEKKNMEHFRPVPDEIDYLFTFASALMGHGLESYAAPRFKEILNRDPNDHETLVRLSRCEMERGLHEFAILYLRRAASIKPKDGRGYKELGNCYLEIGLNGLALENLVRARKLGQEDWTVHNNIGLAHTRMEEHAKALEAYLKAAEVAPEVASVRRDLGLAYQKLGHFDKAIEVFENYSELCPENHYPYLLMGDLFDEMGDFSRAAEAYEKAVQICPDYWPYVNLGRVYEKLKRLPDARASYQEALKIWPRYREARARLFRLDHPDMADLDEEMAQVGKEYPFLEDDPDAVPVIYEEAKRRRVERKEFAKKQQKKRLELN